VNLRICRMDGGYARPDPPRSARSHRREGRSDCSLSVRRGTASGTICS
jgi:hypothetical protein